MNPLTLFHQKMKAKAATREQIENFRASQRVWREREAEARERETAELGRWLEYRAARERGFERAAAERRQAKNTAVLRLAADLRRDQEQAREKEEILQESSTSLFLFFFVAIFALKVQICLKYYLQYITHPCCHPRFKDPCQ
jgi:hypothetical protein